jgi:hypothetical protein
VAAASPVSYLPQKLYLPPEISSRMVYLVDLAFAKQTAGFATPDLTLQLLDPWAGLDVFPFDEFVSSHPRFVVFHHRSDHHLWLMERLRLAKLPVKLVADLGETDIYLVGE